MDHLIAPSLCTVPYPVLYTSPSTAYECSPCPSSLALSRPSYPSPVQVPGAARVDPAETAESSGRLAVLLERCEQLELRPSCGEPFLHALLMRCARTGQDGGRVSQPMDRMWACSMHDICEPAHGSYVGMLRHAASHEIARGPERAGPTGRVSSLPRGGPIRLPWRCHQRGLETGPRRGSRRGSKVKGFMGIQAWATPREGVGMPQGGCGDATGGLIGLSCETLEDCEALMPHLLCRHWRSARPWAARMPSSGVRSRRHCSAAPFPQPRSLLPVAVGLTLGCPMSLPRCP